MALLSKEWIEQGAIGADQITLENNAALKASNAANDGNVNILKVNASDEIEFASVPLVLADAATDNALVRKSQMDTALGLKLNAAEKGAASGVAPLGADSKISATYLPSYVDDIIEGANLAAFPAEGETGKIYVALDTGKCYRWSGSAYVEVSPNDVNSVNGKSGIVVLDADDIAEKAESPTNLYFTSARAKAAAVANSITEGVTDVAPSQGAVFTALAGKEPANSNIQTHIGTAGIHFEMLDEDNFASDSNTKAATQQSIKAYVDTAVGAVQGADAEYEVKTLAAQDITNQYVDLGFVALADSILVFPKGGLPQEHGVDYTISYTGGAGGVTRITFAGDLASKLIAGHKLVIKYLKG